MRILFAAVLLASFTASATCTLPPAPPLAPAWEYYDQDDRTAWDATALASVAGSAASHVTAVNIGYVMVQQRRLLFLAPPQLATPVSDTPWSDDDRRFFAAATAAALEGAAGKKDFVSDYSAIVTRASSQARLVMDFRKTRLCGS
jgi:hypothetical protein